MCAHSSSRQLGQVLTTHIDLEYAAVSIDPASLVEIDLSRMEHASIQFLHLSDFLLLLTVRC